MTNKEHNAIEYISSILEMQKKITKQAIERNSPYAQKQKDILDFISKMSLNLLYILSD